MIVAACLGVALCLVPLTGGHLSRLVEFPLRHTWLMFVGFAIQLLAISILPTMNDAMAETLHLASYAIAAMFFGLNLHTKWLWLVGAGGAMNLAAIVANGGIMPASRWATKAAGITIQSGEFANSKALDDPNLPIFGDIFAIPANWPLSNVFSIGDVVLVIGAYVVLRVACSPPSSAAIDTTDSPGSRLA